MDEKYSDFHMEVFNWRQDSEGNTSAQKKNVNLACSCVIYILIKASAANYHGFINPPSAPTNTEIARICISSENFPRNIRITNENLEIRRYQKWFIYCNMICSVDRDVRIF